MDPFLGYKIKIGLAVLTTILVIAIFGWGGGGVVGILWAIFLTKASSPLHRW